MNLAEKLRRLAEVTSTQWGMITTAQAKTLGVSRVDLARMADAGHLERLAHGVYRDSGIPDDRWSELRAAWLSTSPKLLAEARDRRGGDVTVAGESAALLNGIGDHRAHRHEFVAPQRRQTQRSDIRYRQRELDPVDVTMAEGLPVMTMERTIADLLESNIDFSLVADTLRDAVRHRSLDLDRLNALLAPLASRNGLTAGDGQGLYDKLAETAQLDAEEAAEILTRASTRPGLWQHLLKDWTLADPIAKLMQDYSSNSLKTFSALKALDKVDPNWVNGMQQDYLATVEAIRPLVVEEVLLGSAFKDIVAMYRPPTAESLLGTQSQLGLHLDPETVTNDDGDPDMSGSVNESETPSDE